MPLKLLRDSIQDTIFLAIDSDGDKIYDDYVHFQPPTIYQMQSTTFNYLILMRVSPSSTLVNTRADYTIYFTNEGVIDINSLLVIVFPQEFDSIPISKTFECSFFDGVTTTSLTCTSLVKKFKLTVPTSVLISQQIRIKIFNVPNPSW